MSTTAMAYLKGLADLVNLDAPLLIAYDPFNAISYGEESVVNVPERANSGALLKAR